jgi:hypothetical protein
MVKTTQFSDLELRNYYYNNEVMFFTTSAVQQLYYSEVQRQFYFLKVAKVSNFCPRGRYFAYTPEIARRYIRDYATA